MGWRDETKDMNMYKMYNEVLWLDKKVTLASKYLGTFILFVKDFFWSFKDSADCEMFGVRVTSWL